ALFVLPGIIAYKMFPHLERPDSAYLVLVQTLIPAGVRGLILAAIAAALMSHISSMLNSTSTILTMDLYQKWRPAAGQRDLVRAGQWSGLAILLAGIAIALYFSTLKASFLFVLIQNVFAYIAPPFAVIFTLGILWRRANATAALTTICLGFPFTLLLQYVLFERVAWLHPYSNYLHRAGISWVFCMIVMIATSLLTPAPPKERVAGILWTPRYSLLPQKLQAIYGGWKDLRLWWALLVIVIWAI